MSLGEVIYQGKTNDDKEFILRYPQAEDLEKLHNYINTLSKERTFIRFQGEEITLEQETEVFGKWLSAINKNTMVQLLGFVNDDLICVSDIILKDKIESHIGIFGITVAKEYRHQGLGKILMEEVLKEAEKNIPNLKIVELGCFGNNEVAINLYKELGFLEFGRLPEGIFYNGEFVDYVYMFKKIK